MAIFDTLGISASGCSRNRKWLDAVSDNISNINTATSTDQSRLQGAVSSRPRPSTTAPARAASASPARSSAAARAGWSTSPTNPLADKDGYVRYPDIDLGDQMTQMIMAQRGYQANLSVIDRATKAYQAALQLGKG